MKEEADLRKEKEAVCCYVHVDVHVYISCTRMHTSVYIYYIYKYMYTHQLSVCRFGPYFVEPIVAGLDAKTGVPYIATMDLIGCPMETKDFVVGGTCTEQLYGMCESLWRPDLVSYL